MIDIGNLLLIASPIVIWVTYLILRDLENEREHKREIQEYLSNFNSWRIEDREPVQARSSMVERQSYMLEVGGSSPPAPTSGGKYEP